MDVPVTVLAIDAKQTRESINRHKDEKLVIYGCGSLGIRFYSFLRNMHYTAEYFIDKDSDKILESPYGKEVRSIQSFAKQYSDETIIVTPYDHRVEIRSELVAVGIPNNKIMDLPTLKIEQQVRIADESHCISSELVNAERQKTDEPFFTIITIAYNIAERYLRRAIESVLSQSYRNFQYIIVDNGITDEVTRKVISEYKNIDSRINVLYNSQNIAACTFHEKDAIDEMWLKIASEVRGKYSILLDAGNYFFENILENAFALCSKQDIDYVVVPALEFPETDYDGRYLVPRSLTLEERIITEECDKWNFFSSNMIHTYWGIIVKSDALMKHGKLLSGYNNVECPDTECSWEIYKESNSIAALNSLGYGYSMRTDSNVNKSRLLTVLSPLRLFESFFEPIIRIWEELNLDVIEQMYFIFINQYLFCMLSDNSINEILKLEGEEKVEIIKRIKKVIEKPYVKYYKENSKIVQDAMQRLGI